MRKLFWCCSAAGALALGSVSVVGYYAYRAPNSTLGRCIRTAASSSIAVQPLAELATVAAQIGDRVVDSQEAAETADAGNESIPGDPQPLEEKTVEIASAAGDIDANSPPAPIVIPEDEPMPPDSEGGIVPATIELSAVPSGADNVCPMVMPYCSDDDQQAPAKLVMPYAEDDTSNAAMAGDDSENSEFKAWKKLFDQAEQSGKEDDNAATEELPMPTEEPSAEPKCQEDNHIHEQYPGCPPTTICPYTGKSYPTHEGEPKMGKEESSEEPIHHHRSLKRSEKHGEVPLPTEGVDTMEYRPSDGGLNEYGRGPL